MTTQLTTTPPASSYNQPVLSIDGNPFGSNDRLPKNFSLRGFRYTQVKRENDHAIYLQENDVPIDSKDYYFYYEVIQIKKQKAHQTIIKGQSILYPEKEVYPNNKSWGLSGWTFKSFTHAEAHFLKLIKKVPPGAT